MTVSITSASIPGSLYPLGTKSTTTNALGVWTLQEIPEGTHTIQASKGNAFTFSFSATVVANTTSTPEAATVQQALTSAFQQGLASKVAVVTGLFDSVETILARLGMGSVEAGIFGERLKPGTESFTIII